ncbi:4'-phosphopantetheinyl transferase superfamily protein [Arcicella aquatica]|uniref:4'-phosphopantetheinyl transferase superfamily protein n=1 Tax=Arcicella aquatica TaxID=217141 RepID=A0ABU5QU05_9BACT|nr:4'-phosphopantetheinyl transferase superfamily protein [Arcicella aquatica]MEA5260596.1 4'-phosphopantetheinyl transferase superfamily protein [Arcicella aquatica]
MAIIFCKEISKKSILTLWKIEESPSFYLEYLEIKENDLIDISDVTHPAKQLEWLASRTCAKYTLSLFGITYEGIAKDSYKNPYLINNHAAYISLSHTNEYAAVIISLDEEVGIDIEKVSDKLSRVSHKFLRASELNHAGEDLLKLCIYWCAKESLYKWYGKKNLSLKDNIYIEPFEDKPSKLTGEIFIEGKLKTEHELLVIYFDDYVLTVT